MDSTIQAAPVISSSHQNRVLDAALSNRRPTGPAGVVVAWRGPGTLDEVLRRLGRRGARTTAGHR